MSTALINLPVINENNALSTFLAEVKTTMIPLVPEMFNFVKPELKLGFQRITVDLKKDAYMVDGGKYALHLSKLNEIAQAAGVKITDSRAIERVSDESGRYIFIKHQIKWEMKSIDGSTKGGVITGEYSYQEDVARFTLKDDKYKWVNGKPTNTVIGKKGDVNFDQVNKRRAHGGKLAESNAISRMINKALTKLSQTFTKEELEKPFLVPCVIEDFSDQLKKYPELEKAYIADRLGITSKIYPTENLQENLPEHKPETEDAVITEIETEDGNQRAEVRGQVQVQGQETFDYDEDRDKSFSIKENRDIMAEGWRDTLEDERVKFFVKMAKRKGKKTPKGKDITEADVKKTPLDRQITVIREMFDLADSPEYAAEAVESL